MVFVMTDPPIPPPSEEQKSEWAKIIIEDIEKRKFYSIENIVNEIFTIDEPFGHPEVGAHMKEMDSIVKKLVGQLRYETLSLQELFEDALIKTHKNHLLINSALIILGIIAFFIGFIVSLYMVKIL